MADEEIELKPFWLQSECRNTLDPNWVPPPLAIVMDYDSLSLIISDECPCIPCPVCPDCHDMEVYEGVEIVGRGPYFELWGIPCGDDTDCDVDEFQMVGNFIYDYRWAYDKWGFEGCWWHELNKKDGCLYWYVVGSCGPEFIGRTKNCGDNDCTARQIILTKSCVLHGLPHRRATGWLYKLDNPSDMIPIIFWWIDTYASTSGEAGDRVAWLSVLDCECKEQRVGVIEHSPSLAVLSLKSFGYGFIAVRSACEDNLCQAKLAILLSMANENGWEVHGEGVLVHLATCKVDGSVRAYGNWYALRDQEWTTYDGHSYGEGLAYDRALCAVETPDGYWVLGCNCDGPTFEEKNSPVPGYRLYLELPGVCSCDWNSPTYVDRELILTYPDIFGIDDVVWGNDNKFEYEYDTTESNPMEGTTYTSHHEGCIPCGNFGTPNQGDGMTMFIDYRAMCFIGRAFGEDGTEKTWVRVIYPQGSEGVPYYNYGTHYFAVPGNSFGPPYGIYDAASFTGTFFQPFVRDTEIYYEVDGRRYMDGLNFTGFGYVWSPTGMIVGVHINVCNPTETCDYNITSQQDAENAAGCNQQAPTPCIIVLSQNDVLWDKPALLSPDFTVVEHACQIRRVQPDPGWEWYYYCYIHKWWEIGANIGECTWAMLNVHYVRTNKGFIIKGLEGYQGSYVLLGASNYPQYAWCWNDEAKNPQQDPWSGEWNDPYHWRDQTITCPVDEDMHFCIEDFDIIPED